jgi:glutathione S-transferase
MELYQAEWCPHSHRVRQRMTELGVEYMIRQVAADPGRRDDVERAAGTTEIPVLVLHDGAPICGADQIIEYLDRFTERDDAEEHRAKAIDEVREFAELRAA